MGRTEIFMLYLAKYFVIVAIITEYLSRFLSTRYQQINARLPVTFKLLVVVLYLTTIAAAGTHVPKVHEELDEEMPQYVRTARHSDGPKNVHQPSFFDYRTVIQQDRMKAQYHRQQQSDLRNLKFQPVNSDAFFELDQYLSQGRGTPMNIPFKEGLGDDWKPFEPKYNAVPRPKRPIEVVGKNRFSEIKKDDVSVKKTSGNDLDTAGSESKDVVAEVDRKDQNTQYIYVKPSILKNNFGLDSKTTQKILKNSSPESAIPKSGEYQISELQELLGKNPEYQLQGLQNLLKIASPAVQNHIPTQDVPSSINIEHNGSPILSSNQPIDELQKQIDAVNAAHADAALAAAQKQAEAHVKAQHAAIALAQQQAQDEAYAKIAAHNQGISPLGATDNLQIIEEHLPAAATSPGESQPPSAQHSLQNAEIQQINQNTISSQAEKDGEESVQVENVDTPQTLALHSRPYEEILLQQPHREEKSYVDLRDSKPRVAAAQQPFYQPAPFAKVQFKPVRIQPLTAVPEIYAPTKVLQQVPPPSIQSFVPQKYEERPVKTSFVPITSQHEHRYETIPQEKPISVPSSVVHSSENQLYSEAKHQQHDDLHQYAEKYAFGYRILDEQHGNDFGHEEERDGKLTKGHYFAQLPDGRRQKVEYYVDKSGYHAKVSYENVARHPYEHQHSRDEHKRNDEHHDHEVVHE